MSNKKSFKPGTLLSPIAAVMVSCGDESIKNIITIAWTGIINSEPPMTYISVRKSRYSHDIIEKTGEFVINLVSEELAFANDYCGVKSGRDVDKFKEMNLTAIPSEKVACPSIAEAPVNLECKVVEVHEYPSHDMFVAEIVNVRVNEDLVDEKGKMDFAAAKLVAYVHGEYYGIKKNPIGKFGYSVMKPKTRKRINREAHQQRVQKNQAARKNQASRKSKGGR